MRQTILLGVGVAVIVLGYLWVETQFDPVKYEREHIEQEEVEEVITEPEYPAEWLEEAEAAKEAVIQKRKLEAERDELIESRTEIQERINEIEKELGLYWRDPANIRRLIRETFPEVPDTAVEVARLESQYQMVQSRERYTFTDHRRGIVAGQRERSFCIFQIHEPDHHQTAVSLGLGDYKTNVESCVKMARHIYESSGHRFTPWSVYNNQIALR